MPEIQIVQDATPVHKIRHVASRQLVFMCMIVFFLWAIELFDQLLFGGTLDNFGIHPRTLEGVIGILFAPFLHGGWGHLISNTVPLFVLGWLVLMSGNRQFIEVSIMVVVMSGVAIWSLGAPGTVHLGASVLIFGYFGFLLLRGIFERRIVYLVVTLFVGLVYGTTLFYGLIPQEGVSWSGHAFGFLGGVFAAWILHGASARKLKEMSEIEA